MKKIYEKTLYFVGLLAFSLTMLTLPFSYALAYITPTISVSYQNNGYAQMTVYGDPNSTVQLYYPNQYNYTQNINIGNTNYLGYLITAINPSQYNIPDGSSVYVIVNGISSQAIIWSNYYNNNYYNNNNYYDNNDNYYYNNYNNLYLSQNNIDIYQNQSSSIKIYGNGNYYISNNSNPYSIGAIINNDTLNIYANNIGLSSITVCQNYGSGNCATINVNVIQNVVTYQPQYYSAPRFSYNYYRPIMNFPHYFFRRWWW